MRPLTWMFNDLSVQVLQEFADTASVVPRYSPDVTLWAIRTRLREKWRREARAKVVSKEKRKSKTARYLMNVNSDPVRRAKRLAGKRAWYQAKRKHEAT